MCLAVGVIGIFPDFGKVDIYYLIFPLCFIMLCFPRWYGFGILFGVCFCRLFSFLVSYLVYLVLGFYIVYQVSVINWCCWFYCFYNIVFQVIVMFVIVINVFPYPIDCYVHPWRCFSFCFRFNKCFKLIDILCASGSFILCPPCCFGRKSFFLDIGSGVLFCQR